MLQRSKMGQVFAIIATTLLAGTALAQDSGKQPPMPIEPIGVVESLPRDYPDSWFLVHDAAFFHMSDGKVYIMDTAADSVAEQIQGMFNVSLMGNIGQSASRGEIYSAETFHTRGTRGPRQDVLTIWDKENLSAVAEVLLPGAKRFMGMPQRYAVLPLNKDRWLAVVNFSPAASVTLIDLERRKIIAEIPTPGCSLAYPTGNSGFSSLCADGRFLSTELAADGSIKAQVRTDSFFSSDDNPIFERPAIIDEIAYFPSFDGRVYPVDLGGKVAKVGKSWNMVPSEQEAEHWAPAGIGIIDRDDQGRFYVLMHPGAKDGSQGGGGPEVWVYDARKKQRVQRIALQEWGLSLAVSRGKEPRLLVTNPTDMSLELYDAQSGKFIRKISDFGQETPLMLHAEQ